MNVPCPPQEYRAGRLLTGQLKAKCIAVLQDFVKGFQEVRLVSSSQFNYPYLNMQRRAKITEEDVQRFMDPARKITPTCGKAKPASSPKV